MNAVFALARETGWALDYILWQIAFPLFLQFQHCQLWAGDVWTVAPSPPVSGRLEKLNAFFDSDEEEE